MFILKISFLQIKLKSNPIRLFWHMQDPSVYKRVTLKLLLDLGALTCESYVSRVCEKHLQELNIMLHKLF